MVRSADSVGTVTGEVAHPAPTETGDAVIWPSLTGQAVDLNSLLPSGSPWHLGVLGGITENGQYVVGWRTRTVALRSPRCRRPDSTSIPPRWGSRSRFPSLVAARPRRQGRHRSRHMRSRCHSQWVPAPSRKRHLSTRHRARHTLRTGHPHHSSAATDAPYGALLTAPRSITENPPNEAAGVAPACATDGDLTAPGASWAVAALADTPTVPETHTTVATRTSSPPAPVFPSPLIPRTVSPESVPLTGFSLSRRKYEVPPLDQRHTRLGFSQRNDWPCDRA
jgi:hypothetical protein